MAVFSKDSSDKMLGIDYASSDEEEIVSVANQKVRPTNVPKGLR